MHGLMQDQPLLISQLIDFAERHNGSTEIVSRRVEGDLHRYTWAECAQRARRVARALDAHGLDPGDRVATLAWNGYRHLELYYGVSGAGRVLHTLNPRLHADEVTWIVNHADDRVLCFDPTFLPLVQAIHVRCPTVERWVALCDGSHVPADSGIPGLVSYEDWMAAPGLDYAWPRFDEHTASSLCYTSGTTGHPKGVLYSHRSTVLHAYGAVQPDMMGLSSRDSVLPVVPMFHVNAWGLPYAGAMVGCKLVFPGPALDGRSLHGLIESEQVTFAAGVPTVWQMLLDHVQSVGGKFATLRRTVIGGAACPPAMLRAFEQQHDVRVLHGWGMTEMSPLGTICSLKKQHDALPVDERLHILEKQGRAVHGVEIKVVGEDGQDLPWDGRSAGELLVRGPWIARDYFRSTADGPLVDGWFPTGDVAHIDEDGYLQITDRSKDLIKSGGEWISSIEIEHIAMAHPAVGMAACIGIRHPKWDERPVVAVVLRPGAQLTPRELLDFYRDKQLARWQMPDDVVFVDAIPLGATGKMLKTRLREQLKDHRWTT
ncbi:3-(methylthio)propionyl-CoA ligase [Aquincola tertiaricarbonis]|uniref:3-(methylthio)propionyl-CoA ligase n=1 Tax=Aquincola tertiaricarbonis TaxID=391953 RepID=UPI000614C822|nr:3-(methylthio)propionyl-CoA ligase [Aquincola tertiaricarbonis]